MKHTLPFELSWVSESEIASRNRVLRRIPGGLAGVALDGAEGVLGGTGRFHITGVSLSPNLSSGNWIPIALSRTADVESPRAVAALAPDAAARMIAKVLGRRDEERSDLSAENLSSGEMGALLFVADRLACSWTRAGGERVMVRGVLADAEQTSDYLEGVPAVEVRGVLCAGEQRSPVRFWCRALEVAGPVGPRSLLPGLGWRVGLAVCVGGARLSLSDMQGVEIGDRIVLDTWCFPGYGSYGDAPLLRCGAWRGYGRFAADDEMRIVAETELESVMENESTGFAEQRATLTDTDDAAAGEMTVDVTIEAGRLTMPVREALGLVPGKVIRLDAPVGPEVRIVVGGKLTARGRLVDADGVLGVEVTSVVQANVGRSDS